MLDVVVFVVLALAGLVLVSLSLVALTSLWEWWVDRRGAVKDARSDLARQAALRAWRMRQHEFEAEQRIRQATRQAFDSLLTESRRQSMSNHPSNGRDGL
ncbi:MAG: hypothetical protein LBU05_01055 [Bifidobacteriaceae bacterium]|nr:hypothetical protein [Bifidobacteriaceae bacterium]